MINGAESGLNGQDGSGGNNVDPLDVFCGDNICNARAADEANTCLQGVPSTVVGEKFFYLIISIIFQNEYAFSSFNNIYINVKN